MKNPLGKYPTGFFVTTIKALSPPHSQRKNKIMPIILYTQISNSYVVFTDEYAV